MSKTYHNTNDIESDLREALKDADKLSSATKWCAYTAAIQAAYELGAKEAKQLRFDVRRAESMWAQWKGIAEELMEQQAMPDRDLDSRISNLYQLEKEIAEGL